MWRPPPPSPQRKLIDNNERSARTGSDRSSAVGVKPRLAEANAVFATRKCRDGTAAAIILILDAPSALSLRGGIILHLHYSDTDAARDLDSRAGFL
jgi:hypothetical protein